MDNRFKIKSLLSVVLLSGFCGFSVAGTEKNVEENNDLAPEATTTQIEATVNRLGDFFWPIPILEKAFINTKPSDRKDGIIVGELGIDGGDKAMILKLAQEIADTRHGKFDSFLISHKGKLIFESYYARGRINLPHHQASATKSYTSFLLGRAIALGYLQLTAERILPAFIGNSISSISEKNDSQD